MAKRIKSAIKRAKIAKRNNLRNSMHKSRMKTAIKTLLKDISLHSPKLEETLRQTISTIDKTAQKGVIHKNKAARLKSRLVKKVNALKAS